MIYLNNFTNFAGNISSIRFNTRDYLIDNIIDIKTLKQIFLKYSIINKTPNSGMKHLKIKETIINIYLNRNDIFKSRL